MKEADENNSAPQHYAGYSSYMGVSTNSKMSPRSDFDGASYHFEIPNLSSMLYEFTNKEKELVEK